jgi:hypothetical protein
MSCSVLNGLRGMQMRRKPDSRIKERRYENRAGVVPAVGRTCRAKAVF